MFSMIDRVDSSLIDCINIVKSTLQHKKQDLTGKSYKKPEKANPRLERMGPPLSRTPQDPSPKPVQKWTPEPTDISDPLFDKDLDEFMESLDNLEPYDDLRIGQTISTCSWMPCAIHPTWSTSSGRKSSSRSKEKHLKPQKSLASRFSTSHGSRNQKGLLQLSPGYIG